jgi:hypothetical protein
MIHRSDVLKEWRIREDDRQNRIQFSVKFFTMDGRVRFFPRAIAMGVNGNMKKNRLIGCMPVDKDGNKLGHITPVNIDFILEFNGQKVWY